MLKKLKRLRKKKARNNITGVSTKILSGMHLAGFFVLCYSFSRLFVKHSC
jgi:hypothetical protein